MASVWETRRNVAAGTGAAGRAAGRRVHPGGPPSPPWPRRRPTAPPTRQSSQALVLSPLGTPTLSSLSQFSQILICLSSDFLLIFFSRVPSSSTSFSSFSRFSSLGLSRCLYLDLNTHLLSSLYLGLGYTLCLFVSVSPWLLICAFGYGSPRLAPRDAAAFSSSCRPLLRSVRRGLGRGNLDCG